MKYSLQSSQTKAISQSSLQLVYSESLLDEFSLLTLTLTITGSRSIRIIQSDCQRSVLPLKPAILRRQGDRHGLKLAIGSLPDQSRMGVSDLHSGQSDRFRKLLSVLVQVVPAELQQGALELTPSQMWPTLAGLQPFRDRLTHPARHFLLATANRSRFRLVPSCTSLQMHPLFARLHLPTTFSPLGFAFEVRCAGSESPPARRALLLN